MIRDGLLAHDKDTATICGNQHAGACLGIDLRPRSIREILLFQKYLVGFEMPRLFCVLVQQSEGWLWNVTEKRDVDDLRARKVGMRVEVCSGI